MILHSDWSVATGLFWHSKNVQDCPVRYQINVPVQIIALV